VSGPQRVIAPPEVGDAGHHAAAEVHQQARTVAVDPIGGWLSSTGMAVPTIARLVLALAALTLAAGCSTTATGTDTADRPATTIAAAPSTTALGATADQGENVAACRAMEVYPGVHHPVRTQRCIAFPGGQMIKAATSGRLAVRGRLYAETSRTLSGLDWRAAAAEGCWRDRAF
jgi:hypothetical protein